MLMHLNLLLMLESQVLQKLLLLLLLLLQLLLLLLLLLLDELLLMHQLNGRINDNGKSWWHSGLRYHRRHALRHLRKTGRLGLHQLRRID